MGIKFTDVALLVTLLDKLNLPRCRVLTLGVQDCYFNYENGRKFLATRGFPCKDIPAAEVKLTTSYTSLTQADGRKDFVHQKTLFRMLGFEEGNVRAMDASDYEGADFVHDLNYPVPAEMHGKFDLVFDGGTLEHIFSLKDALFNIASLVSVGGLAVHSSPNNFFPHGFVNINPVLFHEFYRVNGFDELRLQLVRNRSANHIFA